jgi:hypothetical protein
MEEDKTSSVNSSSNVHRKEASLKNKSLDAGQISKKSKQIKKRERESMN